MNKPMLITTIVAVISFSAAFVSYAGSHADKATGHTEEPHGHKDHAEEDQTSKESHDHKEHAKEDKSSKESHDHDGNNTNEEKKKGKKEGKEGKEEHGDHEEKGGGGHGEEAAKADAELSPAQLKQAGIETITIQEQSVSQQISAPAEIMLNQYRTSQVTANVTSQVKKRFVHLGEYVKKGQKLATLKAVTTPELAANMISIADLEAGLASAKGEFQAADSEWKRVKSIGKDLISQKRIDDAKIARDQAKSKVRAYRNSQKKMQGLLSTGLSRNSTLTITAPQAGVVIDDNFVTGQVVESNDVLFKISDMQRLWIEARVTPKQVSIIQENSSVSITVRKQVLQGKVINIGRILDEETRTLSVRIELSAKSPSLYPGQFVQVKIKSTESHTGITVPNQAVLRSADGDWMVLVESSAGRFEPKEIEVKQTLGDKTVIAGIDVGSKIVSKGAFFVQSEIAKSGFSIHNH